MKHLIYVGALILDTPLLVNAVKWAGALVLVWFAWKIGTSGAPHRAGETRPIGFVGAAAFQWINPKSWLACLSAAGTYLDPNHGSAAAQAAVLALLFVAAALPSCSVWLGRGTSLSPARRLLARLRARPSPTAVAWSRAGRRESTAWPWTRRSGSGDMT